jgi:hypothetical protein
MPQISSISNAVKPRSTGALTASATLLGSGQVAVSATAVMAPPPVVQGGAFDSCVAGFAAGHAGSIVVTGHTWDGTTYGVGGTPGPVVETATPGTYLCRMTYSNLPANTVPIVHWNDGGTTREDAAPLPVGGTGAAGIVAALMATPLSFRNVTGQPVPTVMDAFCSAFCVGAGAANWNPDPTNLTVTLNAPGSRVFRTFNVYVDATGSPIARA